MNGLGLQRQRIINVGQHQRNATFNPESCHKAALPLTSIINGQLIMHQEFCFRAGKKCAKKSATTKYGDVVTRARCFVVVGTAGPERDDIFFMSLC